MTSFFRFRPACLIALASRIKGSEANPGDEGGADRSSTVREIAFGTDLVQSIDRRRQHNELNGPARIRSSLLIAQAHLSQSNAAASSSSNTPLRVCASASSLPDGKPSLLARISDTSIIKHQEDAEARWTATPDLEAEDATDPVSLPPSKDSGIRSARSQQGMRSELLERMKAERALAVASQPVDDIDGKSTNTYSGTSTPAGPTIGVGGEAATAFPVVSVSLTEVVMPGTNDDARARLLAKLAAAKSTYLVENSRGAGNVVADAGVARERPATRENALRAELARRKRAES